MACDTQLPTKALLEKLARQAEHIATVGSGVNAAGQSVNTATNPDTGSVDATIPYIEDLFEQKLASLGYDFVGTYASNPTLQSVGDICQYSDGTFWTAKNPPYTVDSATYPAPTDDAANLKLVNEVTFAALGFLPWEAGQTAEANQTRRYVKPDGGYVDVYATVATVMGPEPDFNVFKPAHGFTEYSSVAELVSGTPFPASEGLVVCTGSTKWRVTSGAKGISLDNGLRAISLNGLWIDDFGCVADGEIVSVVGDGTRVITGSDNSLAFKSAMDAFLSGAGKALIASSGQYNFNESGILSYAGSLSQLQGYTLKGAGGASKNTNFVLITENKTFKWFYQNGVGTKNYQFIKIEGICFGSDSMLYGGFENVWSDGHEQGFSHTDVRVEFMNEVTKTEGAANASEFKWFGCKFNHIYSAVLFLDNPQSVNHEYYSTDAEVILGDVVRVGSIGGGVVKWNGGSIILSNHGSVADKESMILRNVASASGLGTGNQDFVFSQIKTELKSPLKKLYAAKNTAGNVITVKFLNSNLTTTTGGAREAVSVKSGHIVRFDGCELPSEFTYKVIGTNEAAAQNGLIEFENCKDDSDLASRCSVDNFFGSIRSREGVFSDTTGAGDSPNYATDFDINFTNNGRGAYGSVNKTASLLQNRIGWPYNSGNEQSLMLPVGCIVRNIYVFRPAKGGSSSSYTLKVGSNDKSTVYGQSSTTDQRLDHSFEVTNLNLRVEADENKRRVRVWADGGTELVNNEGYVIVEYV